MTINPAQDFVGLDAKVGCRRCRNSQYGAGSFARGGQPDVCWGCSGTGETLSPRDVKRYKQWVSQRDILWETALCIGRAQVLPNGSDHATTITRAMDLLIANEPHRISRLYASLAAGRAAVVVDALIEYYNQNKS